jgi:hypothetical protein
MRTANIRDEFGRRGLSYQRHRLARSAEDGMKRLSITTAALALMSLNMPVMAAAQDSSTGAPTTPGSAANATPGGAGIVGLSALNPDGTVAGVVQEVVRNEQGEPVHIVIGRGENGSSTTKSRDTDRGSTSFSQADRDRYEIDWDASLGDWADELDNRIDELGDAATEEVQEAWAAVQRNWASLQEATDETWHRTQASFEAAFDAFEREWASSVTSQDGNAT